MKAATFPHSLVVGISGIEMYDILCGLTESTGALPDLALSYEDAICRLEKEKVELLWLDVPAAIACNQEWVTELRTFHQGWLIWGCHRINEREETFAFHNGIDICLRLSETRTLLNARIVALYSRLRQMVTGGSNQRDCVQAETSAIDTLQNGALKVGNSQSQVALNGENLSLSVGEFELLRLLVRHRGRVLNRDFLHRRLIGTEWDGSNRTVDQRIVRLRNKMGDSVDCPKWITSVRGAGYKMNSFD